VATLVAAGFQFELTDDLVQATKARVRALTPGEVLEITVRDPDGESWVFIPHGCPVAIHPWGDGCADADGVLSVLPPPPQPNDSPPAAPLGVPAGACCSATGAVLEGDEWQMGRRRMGAVSWRLLIAEIVVEWARPERVRLSRMRLGRGIRVAYELIASCLPAGGSAS
jgi:hypothetical protein